MKNSKLQSCGLGALVFLCSLSASSARAWGPLGHKVVARIAEERLTPQALKGVRSLLGGSITLDAVANCADAILTSAVPLQCGPLVLDPNSFKDTGIWHYLDVPPAAVIGESALGSYCPGVNNCPVSQVRLRTAILKDPTAPLVQKQLALILVAHFVGDIHQPMHVRPNMGDLGGNQKQVVILGVPKNIHSLWDDLILTEDRTVQSKMDPEPWVLQAKDAIVSNDTAAWSRGDFIEEAGWESFAISRDIIYPDYARRQNIDNSYQEQMQAIVRKRLATAGVRLGAILEDIFGSEPQAITSDTIAK